MRAIAATYEVELSPRTSPTCSGWSRAFAASELSARLGAAPAVHREHWFAFPLMADGPLVNGVVDVLAEEADGTALVVDYKSDRVGDADLEALVEASYGVQRRIYGLACLRAGAPAVEVVHIFLERAAEPVVHRYGPDDAAALERDLRDARGRAARRRVPRRGRPAPRAVRRLPRPGGPLFAPAGPHGPARRGRRGRPLVRLSVSAHASCPSIWSARERRMRPPKRWRTVRPDGPGNIIRGKARRKERP